MQTLTWAGLGTCRPAPRSTITFTATPQPGVTGNPGVGIAVNQTNSASATAQDLTGATGNAAGPYSNGPGSATAHIGSADLTLTKAVGTAPVAGQSGSWLLTVHNSGPDTASGPFTVTDQFNNPAPAGVTGISASGTGWSCTSTAPLSCSRTNPADTLANGASFPTITVGYNVDSDRHRRHVLPTPRRSARAPTTRTRPTTPAPRTPR